MPTIQDYMTASTVVRDNRGNRMLFSYQSRPRDMGRYPGVLVLNDVEGLTDVERQATRRLARWDMLGKAFDIYSRAETVKPEKLVEVADRSKFFAKIPDKRVFADLERVWEVMALLHWTHGKGLGILGFGMGGYYALLFAGMQPECKAVVAVSPRFTDEQTAPKKGEDLKPVKFGSGLYEARADAMIVLPGADPEITAEQSEKLLGACDRQSMVTAPVRYEGIKGRFWDPASADYSEAHSEDMWRGIHAFFDQRLGSR